MVCGNMIEEAKGAKHIKALEGAVDISCMQGARGCCEKVVRGMEMKRLPDSCSLLDLLSVMLQEQGAPEKTRMVLYLPHEESASRAPRIGLR